MEAIEDVVIVGAGIAGIATALGLHRLGIRSLVLESSDTLRTTGFALTAWTNAWKALDALGVGDSLRQSHLQLESLQVSSSSSGLTTSELSFMNRGSKRKHEVRCLQRKLLLEALAKELPNGCIRFGSKVVSCEQSKKLQLVHLADGSTIKTKVLVGSDGVNSVVGKSLGLGKPAFAGRSAIRGLKVFLDGHGLKPEFLLYVGDGVRSGFIPCDEKTIYWFFTFIPSPRSKDCEEDATKMKQFVLSNLGHVPQQIVSLVETSELEAVISAPLRFRRPWDLLRGDIYKGSICVTGDALHPMTPDIGQGGCSALEDAVILARCLGEAFLGKPGHGGDECSGIEIALRKYAKERRWRSIDLVTTAFVVGCLQQSNGWAMNLMRDRFLSGIMARLLLKKAEFDCGLLCSLPSSSSSSS